jgi:hypothetical protein
MKVLKLSLILFLSLSSFTYCLGPLIKPISLYYFIAKLFEPEVNENEAQNQRMNSKPREELKTKRMNLKTKRMNLKTKRMRLKTKRMRLKTKRMKLKTKRMKLKTKRMKLKTKSRFLDKSILLLVMVDTRFLIFLASRQILQSP